jgi:drug/metabolite transporter (DMT)-like permease
MGCDPQSVPPIIPSCSAEIKSLHNQESPMHSFPTAAKFSRGYLIALAAAAFLSTTAIFIRHLTQTYQLPALVLAFWRDLFVVLTLLVALGFFRPALLLLPRRHIGYLCLYGLALSFFNSFWTLSVALTGAAISTVLVYCSAAFTALLGWWLLKERMSWVKIFAIALCLGGCVLVSGILLPSNASASLPGIMAGIVAGLMYAVYSLMGRSASQRGLNPWTTLIYTFVFAALFLLAYNLFLGGILPGTANTSAEMFWLGNSLEGWLVLFALAAVPTVMGFGLYNVSLTYLPSSVANLIVTIEPAFTAVIAFLLLGERLDVLQLFGSAMILGGVVFLRLFENTQ